MAIFETFSKRRKRLESSGQDVYQYKVLPQGFRVQVIHIWRATIGQANYNHYSAENPANQIWNEIQLVLCREMGVFSLTESPDDYPEKQCADLLLSGSTDAALDIIELSFLVIDNFVRKSGWHREVREISQTPDDAIEELNTRFREHGIGYQFADGMLVRIDSQFVHSEVVKPALSLLSEPGFDGAHEEFLNAHDHYRHGRTKEAMGEALKAFESTMKAICDARNWTYGPKDTAKGLLDILFEKELIQSQLANHFAGLRSALEAGLPTVSNPNRHGQGPIPVDVPLHVVAYALHLCASNIVFLVEAHKAKK